MGHSRTRKVGVFFLHRKQRRQDAHGSMALISFVFILSLLRFRSIAKSYFRRADGVLLLYDVTCEKSFLNVREWVDMIEVTPSFTCKLHITYCLV